jgi:tetratricopeptide (TPR) repeat protein
MRRSLLAAAFILLPATALAALAAPPEQGQAIVVTGKSLRETERALDECLARHCPPNEDIDASLAHAENLFVAGDYKKARQTTLAAVGRNAKFAREYPVDVSDLYRANGRIAAHLGEGRDLEFSTNTMRRVLNSSFGPKDPRVVAADLEVATMYASLGKIDAASRKFDQAEHEAHAAGREDLAGLASVRAAWLYQLAGQTDVTKRELRRIADDTDPRRRVAQLSARILLSRLARMEGKPDNVDALIADLRANAGQKPVLLFTPKIDLTRREFEGRTGSTTGLMATENFDDKWIDVGFWVNPDGKVTDAEILRHRGETSWTEPLMRSIAGRLYSPSAAPEGSYRVERYTWTSLWKDDRTGTHMRQRAPDGRIESLDLTAEPQTASR